MSAHRKARILIVDDVPANLLALHAVLESPDYELVEALSGHEAIQACQDEEFALILLDVNMPGLDGYKTAQAIKRLPKNSEAPIIFITATYRDSPHMRKGFEAGAVDYFGKPFDPDILSAKVRVYTNLYLKTKRLEETEELLKSHHQIKMLLEALPVGVLVADLDGQIYEYNEEAIRIWELSSRTFTVDQYKGRYVDSGKVLMAEDWALTKVLQGAPAIKNEVIDIECLDGSRRTICNSAFPIKSKNGQLVGAVGVMQELKSSHASQVNSQVDAKAVEAIRAIARDENPRPSRPRH